MHGIHLRYDVNVAQKDTYRQQMEAICLEATSTGFNSILLSVVISNQQCD